MERVDFKLYIAKNIMHRKQPIECIYIKLHFLPFFPSFLASLSYGFLHFGEEEGASSNDKTRDRLTVFTPVHIPTNIMYI